MGKTDTNNHYKTKKCVLHQPVYLQLEQTTNLEYTEKVPKMRVGLGAWGEAIRTSFDEEKGFWQCIHFLWLL